MNQSVSRSRLCAKFSFYRKIRNYFHYIWAFNYYRALHDLPHQRISTSKQNIFDLFNLGLFNGNECLELVVLQPNTHYQLHYHSLSHAIIFIIKGQGYFQLGEESLAYRGQEKINIPANTSHGFITKTSTLFLSLQSPPILQENGAMDLYYVETPLV